MAHRINNNHFSALVAKSSRLRDEQSVFVVKISFLLKVVEENLLQASLWATAGGSFSACSFLR